jgi:RES domain
MIAFRQADARFPFAWEDTSQPAGRWHAGGEGPAHYFADTPDGAWAEFLRHEEITEPEDLLTIRRRMWSVEIGDPPAERIVLPIDTLTGDPDSYPRCQDAARAIRDRGVRRLTAVTAALKPGGARALRIDSGVHADEPRDGLTIVIFGAPADFRAWVAADAARPAVDLLERVHYFSRNVARRL